MPNGHPEIPLKDAQQMLELVRKQAPKWRVDPHRVGIIGFSAGGHLAAAASTLFTGADNRPDFTILCYAATSDDPDIIDKETFGNLIGPDASAPETFRYSCEKQVTDRTPQAFIALSDDDDNVLPGNSTRYYTALKSRNVPAELHIFPTGGHGWGWSESFRYKDELRAALGRWLEEIRK
ncbi:alpha/beta hydrolase [Alistipes sp. AF48-12]|uniref:alpha/beta hydrolase n=2 Tax=Alistipes TaxID=239759 RepID=UPI000E4FC0BC|nr:alpha/beta hydrolase [Alistipes sp. AF48-12]RHO69955.1 alpha/beta hydrolase [Alistipes sp. AF48-12]